MQGSGLANPAARLFSNPAGDYGSMVNERVGAGNWDSGQELGDTWASRNAFSYGRCGACPRKHTLCARGALLAHMLLGPAGRSRSTFLNKTCMQDCVMEIVCAQL